tara:strand:+ start:3074 stop:3244 length:171 start_codon:yes stop_codon:yes gene_type:complete
VKQDSASKHFQNFGCLTLSFVFVFVAVLTIHKCVSLLKVSKNWHEKIPPGVLGVVT